MIMVDHSQTSYDDDDDDYDYDGDDDDDDDASMWKRQLSLIMPAALLPGGPGPHSDTRSLHYTLIPFESFIYDKHNNNHNDSDCIVGMMMMALINTDCYGMLN